MVAEDLQERLFEFAVKVLRFLGNWRGTGRETDVIKYQLSKSASSSGANYEEAQAAVSRKEFGVKVAISLKEMLESKYWLRIIERLYPEYNEISELVKESEELTRILGSINSKINKRD